MSQATSSSEHQHFEMKIQLTGQLTNFSFTFLLICYYNIIIGDILLINTFNSYRKKVHLLILSQIAAFQTQLYSLHSAVFSCALCPCMTGVSVYDTMKGETLVYRWKPDSGWYLQSSKVAQH